MYIYWNQFPKILIPLEHYDNTNTLFFIEVLETSCVAAGFTSCCVPDNAAHCILSSGCRCDFRCHSRLDCCEDILSICPTST